MVNLSDLWDWLKSREPIEKVTLVVLVSSAIVLSLIKNPIAFLTFVIAFFTALVFIVYYKMLEHMRTDLHVNTYPVLSHYLEYDKFTDREKEKYIRYIRGGFGYRLHIFNFGRGPSIDDEVDTVYVEEGKEPWKRDFHLREAYSKTSPAKEGERALNLTILYRIRAEEEGEDNEERSRFWNSKPAFDGELWVRIKHKDLLTKDYCMCSRYKVVPKTIHLEGQEHRKFPEPLCNHFPKDERCGECPFNHDNETP